MEKIVFPQKIRDSIKSEILSEINNKEIRLDSSDIEYIAAKIQSSIKIEEARLDSENIVLGLLHKVIISEEEKKLAFNKAKIFTKDVRLDFIGEILDQIELPKNGEKGDTGEPGKDAQPLPLTDRDKKEIANLIDITNLVKDRRTDLVELVKQLKSGKIKLPSHAGIDVKEIISEITKILGTDDWKGESRYASMFEHSDPASSTINFTTAGVFVPWITANEGNFSGAPYLTFENNAGGDRFVIGTKGAGKYSIDVYSSFSGSNNIIVEGAIFIKDVEQNNLRPHRKLSAAGDLGSFSAGCIIDVDAGDYIDLRFTSSSNTTLINIFYCSMKMSKVGS